MNITVRKYRARGKNLHPNWVQAQDNTWRVIVDGRVTFSGIPTREAADVIAEDYRRKMTHLCPSCGANVIEVGTMAGWFAGAGAVLVMLCRCGRLVTKRRCEVE